MFEGGVSFEVMSLQQDAHWPPRPGERPDGRTPNMCPFGHPLGPGRMQISWRPCRCPVAVAHHSGHTTYRCGACEQAGWTVIGLRPEHICTAEEAGAGLEWMRRRLGHVVNALEGDMAAGWQREALEAEARRIRRGLATAEAVVAARLLAEAGRRAAPVDVGWAGRHTLAGH